LRVVFDTGILVAALVFPGGRGEAALLRIVEERDTEALSRAAVFLAGLAARVKPARRLRVLAADLDTQ